MSKQTLQEAIEKVRGWYDNPTCRILHRSAVKVVLAAAESAAADRERAEKAEKRADTEMVKRVEAEQAIHRVKYEMQVACQHVDALCNERGLWRCQKEDAEARASACENSVLRCHCGAFVAGVDTQDDVSACPACGSRWFLNEEGCLCYEDGACYGGGRRGAEGARAMAEQWEYVIVGESYLTERRLSELGDAGWEALGVVRGGQGTEELTGVLFKRRREPNNAALTATSAEPVPPDDPLLAPDALLEACEEAEQIMAGYVARIDKGWLVSGTYEQCKAWLARRAAMAASDARPAPEPAP